MAEKTFTNDGSGVTFGYGWGESVRVEAGESITTDNEDVLTAIRKTGQFSQGKKAESAEAETKTVSWKQKEND